MDQAAIAESPSFIDGPQQKVWTSCMVAYGAKFTIDLRFNGEAQRQQSRDAVGALLDSLQPKQ
jgi:hypothetical protein